MSASSFQTFQDVRSPPPLFTYMKEREIQIGDLVCFDGDEDGLLLGVGLIVETRGDIDDIAMLDEAIRDFYDDGDEYWRVSNILPDAPMILVLWSRSSSSKEDDFNLYNIDKMGYSFMWVYPTEVKVITKEGK
jgi:hypothetical protein